eukprot:gene9620-12954_t
MTSSLISYRSNSIQKNNNNSAQKNGFFRINSLPVLSTNEPLNLGNVTKFLEAPFHKKLVCEYKNCGKRFLINGRHHCRVCGNSVCEAHCVENMSIISNVYKVPINFKKICLVCKDKYEKKMSRKKIYAGYHNFLFSPIPENSPLKPNKADDELEDEACFPHLDEAERMVIDESVLEQYRKELAEDEECKVMLDRIELLTEKAIRDNTEIASNREKINEINNLLQVKNEQIQEAHLMIDELKAVAGENTRLQEINLLYNAKQKEMDELNDLIKEKKLLLENVSIELEESKKMIDDNKIELNQSQRLIEDMKQEIERGKAEIESTRAQLLLENQQIEENNQLELQQKIQEIEYAKQEINNRWLQINYANEELEANRKEMENLKFDLEKLKLENENQNYLNNNNNNNNDKSNNLNDVETPLTNAVVVDDVKNDDDNDNSIDTSDNNNDGNVTNESILLFSSEKNEVIPIIDTSHSSPTDGSNNSISMDEGSPSNNVSLDNITAELIENNDIIDNKVLKPTDKELAKLRTISNRKSAEIDSLNRKLKEVSTMLEMKSNDVDFAKGRIKELESELIINHKDVISPSTSIDRRESLDIDQIIEQKRQILESNKLYDDNKRNPKRRYTIFPVGLDNAQPFTINDEDIIAIDNNDDHDNNDDNNNSMSNRTDLEHFYNNSNSTDYNNDDNNHNKSQKAIIDKNNKITRNSFTSSDSNLILSSLDVTDKSSIDDIKRKLLDTYYSLETKNQEFIDSNIRLNKLQLTLVESQIECQKQNEQLGVIIDHLINDRQKLESRVSDLTLASSKTTVELMNELETKKKEYNELQSKVNRLEKKLLETPENNDMKLNNNGNNSSHSTAVITDLKDELNLLHTQINNLKKNRMNNMIAQYSDKKFIDNNNTSSPSLFSSNNHHANTSALFSPHSGVISRVASNRSLNNMDEMEDYKDHPNYSNSPSHHIGSPMYDNAEISSHINTLKSQQLQKRRVSYNIINNQTSSSSSKNKLVSPRSQSMVTIDEQHHPEYESVTLNPLSPTRPANRKQKSLLNNRSYSLQEMEAAAAEIAANGVHSISFYDNNNNNNNENEGQNMNNSDVKEEGVKDPIVNYNSIRVGPPARSNSLLTSLFRKPTELWKDEGSIKIKSPTEDTQKIPEFDSLNENNNNNNNNNNNKLNNYDTTSDKSGNDTIVHQSHENSLKISIQPKINQTQTNHSIISKDSDNLSTSPLSPYILSDDITRVNSNDRDSRLSYSAIYSEYEHNNTPQSDDTQIRSFHLLHDEEQRVSFMNVYGDNSQADLLNPTSPVPTPAVKKRLFGNTSIQKRNNSFLGKSIRLDESQQFQYRDSPYLLSLAWIDYAVECHRFLWTLILSSHKINGDVLFDLRAEAHQAYTKAESIWNTYICNEDGTCVPIGELLIRNGLECVDYRVIQRMIRSYGLQVDISLRTKDMNHLMEVYNTASLLPNTETTRQLTLEGYVMTCNLVTGIDSLHLCFKDCTPCVLKVCSDIEYFRALQWSDECKRSQIDMKVNNIITFELFSKVNKKYMFMPLHPTTLKNLPLISNLASILRFWNQLSTAISCFQSLDFTHMDVKPSNILLTNNGEFSSFWQS